MIFKKPLSMGKGAGSTSGRKPAGEHHPLQLLPMGKNMVIGCCLVAGILWLQGCRSSLKASDPVQLDQTQPIEVTDRSEHQATAYYYYAAAQTVLQSGQLKEAIWLLEKAAELDPESLHLKIELAELLAAGQQYEHALRLVDQILLFQPDYSPALSLGGRIHQKRGEPEKAKHLYEKALATNPVDQNIYVLLGRLYWNDNDMENARRVFQLMAENIPDAYTAYYFLGKVFANQGHIAEASEAYQRALELEPGLEEPLMELIDIYKSQDKHDAVIATYLDLLTYHPQNQKAALELAAYYRQIGQQADGLLLLASIAEQGRNDPKLTSLVFEMFLETKQYPSAVWVLEGMLVATPDSSDLHYLAGVAYDGLQQLQPTLTHFNQVQVSSRFYPDAMINSALLVYNSGDMNRAIDILENARALLPNHVNFYFYLGTFYEALKRFDESIAVFQEGLAIDAENVRILFQLGIVFDKMGRRQESIQAMKTVIQIAPDHANALNYLGYTYAEMGIHLAEAEELIRRAMKSKPEDGYITDSMGWVFYKRGEYETALQWLLKALELVPDDPAILEHVGDVYLKLEQMDQALYYYHQSLDNNPADRGTIEEKIRTLSPAKDHPPMSPKGPDHP